MRDNYVGTCLFEATNVSEGRGTTQPSAIGALLDRQTRIDEGIKEYGFEGVHSVPPGLPVYGKLRESARGVPDPHHRPRPLPAIEFAVRMIDELRARFTEFKMTTYIDLLFGDDLLRTEYIGRPAVDRFFAMNRLSLANWAESSYHERIY